MKFKFIAILVYALMWTPLAEAQDFTTNEIFNLKKVSRRDATTRTLDVDNDGDLDVIRAGGPNNTELQFFVNDGSGNFTVETEFTYENNITFEIGDLDGDDDQDVLVYGRSTEGTRFYIHQNEMGSFAAPVASSTITVLRAFDIADVDNDGLNDIVMGSFNPDNILWAKNEGNLSFASTSILIPEVNHNNRRLRFLEMVDFDDDGDLDAFVTTDGITGSSSIAAYININDGGTFTSSSFSQLTSTPQNDFDIADFNDDGFMDFVVSEVSSGTVNVLLNNGANGFPSTNLITYTPNNDGRVPRSVVGVEKIDFDADGDMDIYVGEVHLLSGANGILFVNDGSANFTLHDKSIADALMVSVDAGTGAFTRQVFGGDFNGDGRVDILTNSNNDGDLILHAPKSDGNYERSYLNTYMIRLNRLQYVDVDGDGFKDFVSVDRTVYGKTIISLGDGTGAFSDQEVVVDNIPFSPRDVLFGDWDGNSIADLIYANQDRVYLVTDALGTNPGDTTTLYTSTPGEYGGSIGNSLDPALVLVDIDGDGDNDLFVTDNAATADEIAWIENTGSGFTEHFQSGLEIDGYKLADLNGDDYLDLVMSDYVNAITPNYVRVALFDANTSQWVVSKEEDVGGSSAVIFVLADVDVDGDKDIVFGSRWMENTGGVFADAASYAGSIGGTDNLIASDINMDGREDVIAVNAVASTSYLSVYINEGENNFTLLPIGGTELPFGTSDGELLIDDFDEDGRMDIASAFINGGSRIPLWFRTCFNSSSEITRTSCGPFTGPSGAIFTESGMFEDIIPNSIGCDSVITVNLTVIDCAGSSDLEFTISGGIDGFGNQIANLDKASLQGDYIRPIDFDNDGDLDILQGGGTSSKELKVFINDGSGNFQVEVVGSYTHPADFEIGDLDNDGDQDILVNGTTVHENLQGSFSEAIPLDLTGLSYRLFHIQDVDGDGLNDIVMGTGSIIWARNEGNFTFSEYQTLFPVTGTINYFEVLDIDNDNDLDAFAVTRGGAYMIIDNGSEVTTTLIGNGGDLTFKDLNGDNFVDFVSSESYSSTDIRGAIVVYLNDQTNTFNGTILKSYNINDYGSLPQINNSISAIDYDSDNDFDLVVGERGFEAKLFINDGVASFTESTNALSGNRMSQRQTGTTVYVPQVFEGDYNGDGRADVLINSNADQDLILHTLELDGSFTANYLNYFMSGISRMQYLDVDNDGFLDFVSSVQSGSGKTMVHYNDGNQNFTLRDEVIHDDLTFTTSDVLLGYWNNNTDVDLFYSNQESVFLITDFLSESPGDTILLYLDNSNRGPGLFVNEDALQLIDMDLDGDKDLTIALGGSSSGAFAWIENMDNETTDIHLTEGLDFNREYKLGDLNNDNYPDLAYIKWLSTFSQNITIALYNPATKQWEPSQVENTFVNPQYLVLADADGDGDKDIILEDRWMANLGDGSFDADGGYAISSTGEMLAGDLNKDGKEDIVGSLADLDPTNIDIYLNEGENTFTKLKVGDGSNPYTGSRSIGLLDIEENGFTDIVSSFNDGGTGGSFPLWFRTCYNTSSEIIESSCGPFTGPSGAIFTESGIFEDIIPNSIGCDSVITINLTITPLYEETVDAGICEGETFEFGSQVLSETGEFTEIFQSEAGCDSTVVLSLTVNSIFNETTQATICDNETFEFGTQSLNTAGEFTEIFQSVTGCDSSVVLTLTVNPAFAIDTTVVVGTGESFEFDGNTLNSDGVYQAPLLTTAGCDSLVNLNLQVNSPPTVPNYTFEVEENSPEITLVGIIEAMDPDNDPLTYSIISGNDLVAFAVTNNARIIVAEPAALDFETTPTFVLEVEVSDGLESVISMVTINLIDVDENTAPSIADQTFSIDENSPFETVVGTVVASDAEGNALFFSIVSGNELDAFNIDNSGELSVATSSVLDFEVNPTFILGVEVTDGGLSSTATITVNLIDVDEVNNTAPSIADQTFSIDENAPDGTIVGTVVASDEDGDDLIFSIINQNVDAFIINQTNGEISVANSQILDFETLAALELNVQVSDGMATSSAIIIVIINDVDEEENTAPIVEDQFFTLNENTENEAFVGQIAATDPENDNLTFTILEGNTAGVLQLVENTGEIFVLDASQIDASQIPEYNMLVNVSDGQLSNVAVIRIEVSSEGSNTAPTLENQSFSVDVSTTNGLLIGTIIATDPENDPLIFQIVAGNESGIFALNENSGELFVADASQIDINVTPTYELAVIVTDGELTDDALITVTVVDGSENTPPVIEAQSFSIIENSSPGVSVGTIAAEDVDNDTLSFAILSGNEAGAFGLNATTGELTVANSSFLDFEANPSFTLQVEVSDGFAVASAPVAVNLIDQEEGNNNPPIVVASISNQSFLENTGSLRIDVSGIFTDSDGDDLRLVAASEDTSIIFATVVEDELVLLGKSLGTTSIRLTAYDDKGGSVSTSFSATLDENTNNVPTITNPIGDVVLTEGFETYRVDLTNVFEDQDGGLLTYDVKSGSEVELVADFNILPECCGSTTGTGRYLDGTHIEFENKSSENAVAFEWSFGSTQENPSGYFELSNFGNHTQTFSLTVSDADGNMAVVEKSYEFQMLFATGFIRIDGERFDLKETFQIGDVNVDYHQYTDGNVGPGFLGYSVNQLPENVILRIGGYPPGLVITGMRQVGQYSPSAANEFYMSYKGYETFDDEGGTESRGGIIINLDTEEENVVDIISLEGKMRNFDGDEIPFIVELNHVPSTCYYNGIFCEDGVNVGGRTNRLRTHTITNEKSSIIQPKKTRHTATDGVITTVIEGSEVVITEVGLGKTDILVIATDDAGAVVTDQFSFEIEEQENRFPEIEDQMFSFDFLNATQGLVIGTIVASDADEDELTFEIEMGNEEGIFALDQSTGVITLASVSALRASSESTFYLDVFAFDGQVFSGALVTVEAKRGPQISDQTFTIDENSSVGAIVGIIQASDPDGGTLTFFIDSGNELEAFALELDGTLKVANSEALDFETTPSFGLIVDVENEFDFSSATITVNLNDINESVNQAPQIETQTFSIDENSAAGAEVGTVAASDPDGEILSYGITSGNDGNTFSISSSSGTIIVANPANLDFEQNESFILNVEVSDGQLSSEASITINLKDIDETVLAMDKAGQPSVYPNPVTNFIRLTNTGTIEGGILRISNLQGQEVKRFIVDDRNRYDVSDLSFGVYLIVIEHDGKVNPLRTIIKQ